MDEKIDAAIGNVLGMIRTNSKAEDALKFAQAAQNLANVKATLASIPEGKAKKQGAGA